MLGRAKSDEWKTKYRDLVRELEAKEREWQKLETALRRASSQLAIAAMGQSRELDEQVGEVVEIMRGSPDTTALGHSLQRLSDTLKRVEREFADTQRIAASPVAELDARMAALMGELVERMRVIPALASSAAELGLYLKRSHTGHDWSGVLAGVADEVATVVAALEAERTELEAFLDEVQDQLAEFESWTKWQRSDVSERRLGTESLETTMTAQMQELRDEAAHSPSLTELKHKVQHRLDAVAAGLKEFRDTEDHRLTEAEARNRKLTQEVAALRNKAGRLAEVVGHQQRHLMLDALTQVHSRYAYEQRIQQEWQRWRQHGHPLAYALWDLDEFKVVNDSYGHSAGDRLLQMVGRIFAEHKRGEDFFARLGGEEFALLLPLTEAPVALEIANGLRSLDENTRFHHQGKPQQITISCGVTEFRDDDTPDSVYARADRALYRAKSEGRNRCIAL
jgi:diguanylate cyclase